MRLPGDYLVQHWRVMYVSILLVYCVVLTSCSSMVNAKTVTPVPTSIPDGPISVVVLDENGQQLSKSLMHHIVVGVKDTWQSDDYDNDRFGIDSCWDGQSISAWAPGYKVTFVPCRSDQFSYEVRLEPLNKNGALYTSWMSAIGECQRCHVDEVAEWGVSSHATTLRDGYFETMYKGSSLNGNVSQQTDWVITANGRIRLPPKDKDLVTFAGPGFRLDYPTENGNCSYCHIPTAQAGTDLTKFFYSEGVTCDVCHKVLGVMLDDTGYPYSDRPGVLSFTFLPQQYDPNFYIGPFANTITSQGEFPKIICSPVFSESTFCAACHYGKFYNMVIYNSYGEWLASPYSQKMVRNEGGQEVENKDYRSCQDCHMLVSDQLQDKLPSEREACSASNHEFSDFNHNMMRNGTESQLIKDAASLTIESEYVVETNSFRVIVKTTNEKAGHKFPTDSPLRHLILVVQASDEQGNSLTQIDGGTIPNWGGVVPNPPPGMKNYGGLPGKIFANLLVDKDTNMSPVSAYWNPTKYAWVDEVTGATSDTRLPPLPFPGDPRSNTDESTYTFTIPSAGNINISVELIYRYAFIELVRQKGWQRPDLVVTLKNCMVDPKNIETLKCNP